MKLAFLLALAFAVGSSLAQQVACGYNTTLYPNGPPTYCNLSPSGSNDFPFQRRDTSPPICFVFGECDQSPQPNATYFTPLWKIAFWPQQDIFTLLQVFNAFSNGQFNLTYNDTFGHQQFEKVQLMNSTKLAMQIEIGDKTTGAQPFYSFPCEPENPQVGCSIVPFFTAIITVDGRRATSIAWDNAGCFSCNGPACISGPGSSFCGIDYNSRCLGPNTDGTTDCDPKVYLGWFGQDSNGAYLTSAGQRLSAFRSYSLAAAYNSAADTAQSAAPSFPDPGTVPTVDFNQ